MGRFPKSFGRKPDLSLGAIVSLVAHVRGALGEEFKITNRCVLDGSDKPAWQAVAAESFGES
jgi:hypothetical protein